MPEVGQITGLVGRVEVDGESNAKQLRRAPRKIAEQLVPLVSGVEGVERITVAGAASKAF